MNSMWMFLAIISLIIVIVGSFFLGYYLNQYSEEEHKSSSLVLALGIGIPSLLIGIPLTIFSFKKAFNNGNVLKNEMMQFLKE